MGQFQVNSPKRKYLLDSASLWFLGQTSVGNIEDLFLGEQPSALWNDQILFSTYMDPQVEIFPSCGL